MNEITKIKEMIRNSEKIVIFTGAGISVPSGIPDFRSANGLYNQDTNFRATPEEIISHSFFLKHPVVFYDFYRNKMLYPDAIPNIAHKYFAELENEKQITIITQNIDGLHTLAGSKNVLELHGSIHRNYCMKCGKKYPLKAMFTKIAVPTCDCGGTIKPDVVLYEEQLNQETLYKSIKAISEADLLFVIGTSLIVQPAASLIRYFNHDDIILINKEKTPYDRYAKITINDDIINVITKIINPIL